MCNCIPFHDVELHPETLELEASRLICAVIPEWSTKKLKYEKLTEGLSNFLLAMFPNGDDENQSIIVKLYGLNSDLLIDREQEIRTMAELYKHKFSDQQILLKFRNGYFYTYLPGKQMDPKSVRNEHLSSIIVQKLAEFHSLTPKFEFKPSKQQFTEKLRHYLNILSGKNPQVSQREPASSVGVLSTVKQYLGISERLTLDKTEDLINYKLSDLERDIEAMEVIFEEKWTLQVIYSHMDTQSRNFLYDKHTDQIGMIDFEHCMFNYWLFDLSNYFLEFAGLSASPDFSLYPDRKFQKQVLTVYLKHAEFFQHTSLVKDRLNPTDDELEHLCDLSDQLTVPAHLYWSLWALLQALLNPAATDNFNYVSYGQKRFQQYVKDRQKFFNT
ncbi:unnamed protein product [Didymodactylos carnosus]|uniref:ethanolamine kinase n=1 Tax=Didymodactylos carnosus TaxID=1234261 RepID=A0A814EDB3_9BILA|nr:unnamed protein product [Didymodactylos carnosus]CAF0967947.1 unnamed protein product [Didymodactylos carnosus]CAF0967967.1 unnamed protein product [Didymodactylos carnosus]CAF3594548.1 unnamed protein product [Didymodactylos carnosus]CAF3741273.1 unnamed protein product [Didymodactylos carnosus]